MKDDKYILNKLDEINKLEITLSKEIKILSKHLPDHYILGQILNKVNHLLELHNKKEILTMILI